MSGVGRSKVQPGRPRIREVLGRSVAPVATQPDDKRAGGRVGYFGQNFGIRGAEHHKRATLTQMQPSPTSFPVIQ